MIAINSGAGGRWEVLERDWFGENVEPALGYRLRMTADFLEFSVMGEAVADVGEWEGGTFVEGLWRYDVGELFLGEEGSGRYLEFHIAPGGCWWVGEFSGTSRERVSNWECGGGPEGFIAEAEPVRETGWGATLKVPVRFLEERMGGDVRRWRGNVAGMVRDGNNIRRYLTANGPPPELARPDFHRRELRGKLEIRGGGSDG